MKPTIPEASHKGITPVSSRLPSGTEILYLPHPELRKGNSDLCIPLAALVGCKRGGIIGNPEAEPSGNHFRLKKDENEK